MNSDLIIRLAVLLAALVLVGFIIGRFTRGMIRLIIFGALGLLSVAAVRLALQEFPIAIPNFAARPTAAPTTNTDANLLPTPTPGSTSSPALIPTPTPPQSPSPSEAVSQGQIGLEQATEFAQPFAPAGETANGSSTASGNTSGNTSGNGSTQAQSAQPSRPITGGW